MDGVTSVLTAAQLINYGIDLVGSLYGTYQSLKLRSQTLQQQLKQIYQLGIILGEIRDNNQPNISNGLTVILRAIAERVQDIKGTLDEAIKKQKRGLLIRFLRFPIDETDQQRLQVLFLQLETDKTALILGLQNSLAKKIYSVLDSYHSLTVTELTAKRTSLSSSTMVPKPGVLPTPAVSPASSLAKAPSPSSLAPFYPATGPAAENALVRVPSSKDGRVSFPGNAFHFGNISPTDNVSSPGGTPAPENPPFSSNTAPPSAKSSNKYLFGGQVRHSDDSKIIFGNVGCSTRENDYEFKRDIETTQRARALYGDTKEFPPGF